MKDFGEFCILIPTRNRRREVEILLKSILGSTIMPSQIIISSSGEDIGNTIQRYSDALEITYIHSEVAGQINQKKLGLSLLSRRIKWVVFLDDDLVVMPDTFENAFSQIEKFENLSHKEVLGLGFSLPTTSRFIKQSNFSRVIAKMFGIKNQPPGRVLNNGHATSYLDQNTVIETQWLNGASIWRVESTRNYGLHGISSSYAACEDLIFSYPVGKVGTLIYCPYARVDFQSSELTNFERPSVYISALYWRYFFVLEHKEFSIMKFNLAQIGRLLFALTHTPEERIKFFLVAFPATLKVLVDSAFSRNSRKFLNSI